MKTEDNSPDHQITNSLILVGRIARTHGVRGDVLVNPETDFPEDRFVEGRVLQLELAGRIEPVTIETVRFHQGRPLVGFAGIETMDAAEAIVGAELKVPEAEIPPLPAGTYYRHDLVGCQVEDTEGRLIGEVTAVEGTMEASRLVIAAPHGEVLIPLVADICVDVKPAEKRIRVAAPDGLLELNERS